MIYKGVQQNFQCLPFISVSSPPTCIIHIPGRGDNSVIRHINSHFKFFFASLYSVGAKPGEHAVEAATAHKALTSQYVKIFLFYM